MANPGWAHRDVRTNGIRLHAVEMGRGPLVLLLHGFPECWYAWRHQLPRLARAGFHAVAPDLRGYNLSDRPGEMEAYRVHELAADVAGLVAALGHDRAALVGHDWGGVVAWAAAELHPERVDRLVIVNAPHPRGFRRALRHPSQALRSWYAGFFQLPGLPEAMLAAGGFALLRRIFRSHPRRRDAYTAADVEVYRQAWARPGALKAMLDYYRAVRLPSPRLTGRIAQPTLVVWGDRDRHLRRQMVGQMGRWVPNLHVRHLPDASHWVPAEEPELLATTIADFLHDA
ncbi:MAG TPA: alpha/beta hydrolase [Longimicrobiaceae bacterium]|nr:alpha/beta hydrolase [Longimicrobiaceae bacterium]